MNGSSRFDRIDLYRSHVPPLTPYRLALAPIGHVDTLAVEVPDREGDVGLGDATMAAAKIQRGTAFAIDGVLQ